MTSGELEDIFQHMADIYMSQRYEDAVIYYAEPLVAYVVTRPELDLTRESTAAAIGRLRSIALEAGATSIRSAIREVEGNTESRFSVLLRWEYLSRERTVLDRSEFRVYCVADPETGLQVEMLEVYRVAFPARHPAGQFTRIH